jgi:cell division protein FtsW
MLSQLRSGRSPGWIDPPVDGDERRRSAISTDAPESSPGPTRPRFRTPSLQQHPWVRAFREALDRPLTTYYLLIGATVLLLVIGLLMVLSASSVWSYRQTGDSYLMARRQFLWVLVAVPAACAMALLPHRLIRQMAYPAFIVSLVLLAATAVVGVEINGNQNWLQVGPLRIQPAELAKLSLVVWAAHIYANKMVRLDRLHHIIVPVVPGTMVLVGLVLAGRDLGTVLIFLGMLAGLLWVAGAPMRFFAITVVIAAGAAMTLAVTSPVRMARLTSFADPFADFHGIGWQPAHALFALSSGGWFGQGIGASRQKWGQLPEAHTDYIFAVLGEELGLVGTLLVVGLFLVIAYGGLRVAWTTEDAFVRFASAGVVFWILGQMMINVGMVLSLLPVIGVPLPLLTYGGSSMVPTLLALGMVIGFARREPEAARALAQKRRARTTGLSARR